MGINETRKENSRMRKMESTMNANRKTASHKPKVPPVMGSKVKMEKMLKKSMASLTVSGKSATNARKINMADSESDDDSEMEDGGQAAALAVPRVDVSAKSRIKKARSSITKSEENALKKSIRKFIRDGNRKEAKVLKQKLTQGVLYRNGRPCPF